MRRKTCVKLAMCTSGVLLGGLAQQGMAQLAVTGNLTTTGVGYGVNVPGTGALTTQTINSSFGDNGSSTGHLNGTELDAAYGVVESGYLYLFLSGNLQDNGNILDVWIADGRAGQNTLTGIPAGTGSMSKENGSVFSPGFNATYALEMNTTDVTPNTNGTFFVDQYNLVGTPNATFIGSVGLTGGVGHGVITGGVAIGVTNTNTAGVVGDANGGAANTANAQAVSTGIEIGIPLASLGNPTGNIEVLAGINGSGDSGFANQFLPGLAVGTPSIKKGNNPYATSSTLQFTFANTPGEFFTVQNTVLANGIWLPTGNGTWDASTQSNWSNNAIPQAVGDTASFSRATAPSTVTLGFNATVGTVNFNDSNSYLLAANAGDTLTLDNGGISAMASIANSGGTHTISAPLQLNSNTTVSCLNHGDQMIISGNISGNGTLEVSNSGTFNTTFSALILSGSNTYSGGTVITRGELQLDSANALPTGTALTIDDPNPHGVLDLNGFNANVSSLTATTGGALPAQITNGNATQGADSTFTYAGSLANPSTFPGEFTDSTSLTGGKLSLVAASGSLTLTGTEAYGGNTTVNSGATLVVSGTGWSDTVIPGGTTVNSGGTLVLSTATGKSIPTGENIQNDGALVINDTLDGRTVSATVTANVAGSISGAGTTTVNAGMALTANNFNQAGGLVNNGTATINGSGTVGPITGAGTLVVNGALQLATSSGLSTMVSLAIGATGTFDVNNNHVIIDYGAGPDPAASIALMIQTGYAGGSWNGTGGIISSAAALASNKYGVGFADSADPGNPAGLSSGTIEITYTLLGDADLNGIVSGIDFGIVAANFNKSVTSWDQGDFDYNQIVSGIDFGDLAANFNQGASGAAAWDALVAFAAQNGLMADVPEPASLGLVAVAGLGVMRRRRRAGRK